LGVNLTIMPFIHQNLPFGGIGIRAWVRRMAGWALTASAT